jgi:hypothetical protein
MDTEGIGDVRTTLTAFSGLAEGTVPEGDAGQAGQSLVASTPGDMGRRLSLTEERK